MNAEEREDAIFWFRAKLKDPAETSKKLTDKSKEIADVFSFPEYTRQQKEEISEYLCDVLQSSEFSSSHIACLEIIRVLTRDPANVDVFLSERLINCLIGLAGLNSESPCSYPDKEESSFNEVIEAQKGLSNAIFQSEKGRRLFLSLGALDPLCERLREHCKPEQDIDYQLRSYDIRLFFIITATCADIRMKSRKELQGMISLISILSKLLESEDKTVAAAIVLNSMNAKLACDVLKALFNLTMGLKSECRDEETVDSCISLGKICRILLLASVNSEKKAEEEEEQLKTNVVNLLTTLPYSSYQWLLVPEEDHHSQPQSVPVYKGQNMECIDVLLGYLGNRLDASARHRNTETLHPILFLLCELARSSRIVRKYMRFKVLPPLGVEVMRPPEEGDSLRNKLVKLMTAVGDVKDVAAEFLFLLCKKSVDRLVKYTGFGNAAGLLANQGLFALRKREEEEAEGSTDEDSDTEEYLRVKDQINPVLGCFEPPRPNPMEGMTEEQKEYEALKLVEQINKMMEQGIIKPATIDEQGKLKPVEHVLELRDKCAGVARGEEEEEESD